MNILSKFLFFSTTIIFFATASLKGQSIISSSYNYGPKEKEDVEKLIGETISFAEDLLKKNGTFPPYSAALTSTGRIAMVGSFLGTDDPASKMAVDNIKAGLRENNRKWKHRAVVVYYPAHVVVPGTTETTDAIAAFAEHRSGKSAHIFYFPYKLSANRQLTLSKDFNSPAKKEFFLPAIAHKKDSTAALHTINK